MRPARAARQEEKPQPPSATKMAKTSRSSINLLTPPP